jgi:hypothetical protein
MDLVLFPCSDYLGSCKNTDSMRKTGDYKPDAQ